MTREQQKKLNKSLPQILKKQVKSYGLKKKDYMVWGKTGEMYFSLLVDVMEKDGHCFCTSSESMKPLWLDDLFWDIMDMPENKSEPLSMRWKTAGNIRIRAYGFKSMLRNTVKNAITDEYLMMHRVKKE